MRPWESFHVGQTVLVREEWPALLGRHWKETILATEITSELGGSMER